MAECPICGESPGYERDIAPLQKSLKAHADAELRKEAAAIALLEQLKEACACLVSTQYVGDDMITPMNITDAICALAKAQLEARNNG